MGLKQLREARLLTQSKLARGAGVSIRSICNWERGTNRPQMNQRRLVLKYLGIPIERHLEVFGPLADLGPQGGRLP